MRRADLFRSYAVLRNVLLLSCLAGATSVPQAGAATVRRAIFNDRGNITMFGNTMAYDCRAGVPAPQLGTIGLCGLNITDTSPDVHFRADSPTVGQAEANLSIGPDEARSTSVLRLPQSATVLYARLYWSAVSPPALAPRRRSSVRASSTR